MDRKQFRSYALGGAISVGVLLPVVLGGCGAASGAMGAAGNIPGAPGKCPDLSKPETIMAFDFAGEFK
ncbi:MAG TPA: hypothetical protein VLT33_38600, partial [Labilithrix sp.]|nr:hypothetical protein [Labilithrix sp.]